MQASTREFMRGRLDALAFGAKTAQDLFEKYLSLEQGCPEKQSCRERLRTVVREIGRSYANVTKHLDKALKEDE